MFIPTHPPADPRLVELAGNGEFKALGSLALNVLIFDYFDPDFGDLDRRLSEFMLALPPLVTLYLCGYFHKATFDAVMQQHGASLRHLTLRPGKEMPHAPPRTPNDVVKPEPFFLSNDEVEDIRRHCPDLLELSLWIHRTQGDGREVAIYRAIGDMRRLKSVDLELECSGFEGPNALTYVPWERYNLDESVRTSFVNAAIDETLVRSIFCLIFGPDSPAESRPGCLKLRAETALAEGPWDIYLDIIRYLGRLLGARRLWAFERKANVTIVTEHTPSSIPLRLYTSPNDVMRAKLFGHLRPQLWRWCGTWNWDEMERMDGITEIRDVWESLWPGTTIRPDWETTWTSWPLDIQDDPRPTMS